MRRILLATDLSGMGEALMAAAADLARAFNAELDVLHICSIDDYPEVQQETGIALDQYVDNLRGRVQETVTKFGPLTAG